MGRLGTIALLLGFVLLPAGILASESDPSPSPTSSKEEESSTKVPEPVKGIQKYAVDDQKGAQKNFGVQTVHDDEIFAVMLGDRLEYQTHEGEELVLWDLQAWVGEDYHKLWFKTEGGWPTDSSTPEEVETEFLYSGNFSSFWDGQIGVRHDFKPNPDRTFAALGVQGLAPFWFEVECTAYISQDGDISAALELEYHFLLTQRLALQPRLETSLAIQEVSEYGVGNGLNDLELGVRLRYEILRKFAPYIGFSWSRKLFETADFARAGGGNVDISSFVAGLHFWF